MVVVWPHAIMFPGFNPISMATSRSSWVCVWSSRVSSGCGDLRIVKKLHRQFILFLRLRNGCGLFDPFGDFPSAINNVRLAQEGAAAAARRRHGLEVEDEGLLKDLVVIFVFLELLCTVRCFF